MGFCYVMRWVWVGKETKAFSYSFNMFHVSHSSVEGGQERFLIELLELNILNEHFSYEFLLHKKYLFIWKNYIW